MGGGKRQLDRPVAVNQHSVEEMPIRQYVLTAIVAHETQASADFFLG